MRIRAGAIVLLGVMLAGNASIAHGQTIHLQVTAVLDLVTPANTVKPWVGPMINKSATVYQPIALVPGEKKPIGLILRMNKTQIDAVLVHEGEEKYIPTPGQAGWLPIRPAKVAETSITGFVFDSPSGLGAERAVVTLDVTMTDDLPQCSPVPEPRKSVA